MSCCDVNPAYEAELKARRAEEEADMNMEVEVNGTKLKVKDMFADYWTAKDFIKTVKLLKKTEGGKALMNTEVEDLGKEAA